MTPEELALKALDRLHQENEKGLKRLAQMDQQLSAAARATYDAFNRIGLYNQPSFETDRKALAAALRAAADQVVPNREVAPQQDLESRREAMVWGMLNQTQVVRHQLLAIAEELENH